MVFDLNWFAGANKSEKKGRSNKINTWGSPLRWKDLVGETDGQTYRQVR